MPRLASSARRVLVVPAEGLAEMLLAYPAISMLRGALPESRIICLVGDGQAEILRGRIFPRSVMKWFKV
jgi:ADP-heptose:LPS heptosyltransferase